MSGVASEGIVRSQDAWANAALCAAKLRKTVGPAERQFLLHMRDGWIEIANKLATIEDGVVSIAKKSGPRRVN